MAESSERAPALLQYLAEVEAIEARIAELDEAVARAFSARLLSFSTALLRSAIPEISLSYRRSYSSPLSADFVDADDDDLDDQAEPFRSHTIAGSARWRLSLRTELAASASYGEARESAEAGAELDASVGWGGSLSRMIVILDPNYAGTDAFKDCLFIPGVVGGISVEGSLCREAESAGCGTDAVVESAALTPFVDLKISKTAQFRIGIPITRRRTVGNSDTSAGITTLISFQLGASK